MARELVAATVSSPGSEHLDGWQIEGWANVNTRGALNKSHHHAGDRPNRNLWSGIYYVDDGGLAAAVREAGASTFGYSSVVPKEMVRCSLPFDRDHSVELMPCIYVYILARLHQTGHYYTEL